MATYISPYSQAELIERLRSISLVGKLRFPYPDIPCYQYIQKREYLLVRRYSPHWKGNTRAQAIIKFTEKAEGTSVTVSIFGPRTFGHRIPNLIGLGIVALCESLLVLLLTDRPLSCKYVFLVPFVLHCLIPTLLIYVLSLGSQDRLSNFIEEWLEVESTKS